MTAGSDIEPVVDMRGILKRFPGVLANDHVDFSLRRGEIHALLGENRGCTQKYYHERPGWFIHAKFWNHQINGKPVNILLPVTAV